MSATTTTSRRGGSDSGSMHAGAAGAGSRRAVFASATETVAHDSHADKATLRSRNVRQVSAHMQTVDWQLLRTLLANERNIMAWTRTFLKILTLTFAVSE